MKKISLLSTIMFLMLGNASLNAQDAIELISQTSCECITEMSENNDQVDVDMAVETCIQQAIFSNLTAIMEDYDFSLTDEEEASRIGEQIGIEVGMKLVTDCPAFMTVMMGSGAYEDDNSNGSLNFGLDDLGSDNAMATPQYETLKGTLVEEEVTRSGFSYLVIEDEYGESSRFLWLNPFSGDELIDEDLEGESVTVEWESMYIRNGKDGEYQKTKIIRRLYY